MIFQKINGHHNMFIERAVKSNMFIHWTKKQKMIGIVLSVITILNILAYGFVSDYDTYKEEVVLQNERAMIDLQENRLSEGILREQELDAKIMSDYSDSKLIQEVAARASYEAIHEKVQMEEIESQPFIVYGIGNDTSSGLVQYLTRPVEVYSFESNGDTVTTEPYGTYAIEVIEIIEE